MRIILVILSLVHISLQRSYYCASSVFEEWKYSNSCMDKCGSLGCTKEGYYGCFCKQGFKRDEKGICISEEHCPIKQCPGKELFF